MIGKYKVPFVMPRTFVIAFAMISVLGVAFGVTRHVMTGGSFSLGGVDTTAEVVSNIVAVPDGHTKIATRGLEDGDIATTPPADGSPPQPGKGVIAQKAPKVLKPVEDMLPGLHETKTEGLVPMVRADGFTPYQAYRAPFSPAAGTKALVSLVMIDYGLSAARAETVLKELPAAVTLAASPYATDLQPLVTKARGYGHEVWMGVPVQSVSFPDDDAGPTSILATSGADQKKSKLLQNLARATGYAGAVILTDPSYIRSKVDIAPLVTTIYERGLGLIETDTADKSTAAIAAMQKMPFGQAFVWLDDQPGAEAVGKQLEAVEKRAIAEQKVIVMFRPLPSSIDTVAAWADRAARKGIELAPLTAVIDLK